VLCALLSLAFHGLAALGLEFQAWDQAIPKHIVLVDVLLSPSMSSTEPLRLPSRPSASPEISRPVTVKPSVPGVKISAKKIAAPRTASNPKISNQKTLVPMGLQHPPTNTQQLSTQVPALLVTNDTSIILANESGQDSLKHGAEARFMHGVATEEFVEENYVGEYSLGSAGRVWIEDDRKRSGHLILHAEHMDFTRPLFRFNRFIYVYGENPESPSPILGSVTFFSDGDHIHQFLCQHNSTKAYFPHRN
jgi:hypothetical protein